jgi:D-alanine-D-alanine ligase-like ATP-grasp enzyme
MQMSVAPDFKNKTIYTPYVSPGSQTSHIATNKDNIKRQCLLYNILVVKDITLDNKQRKDNSGL